MKVDSDRLRTIRQRKKLSRPDLERASGITVRTIQRLENDPDECKSTREDTVMRLAKALEVEPGVLTGELPVPEPGESPASEPDPVRIGAQIPPKARLAYDLIKRRYGVNTTDVITMAPLFFALLAEGSLKWRQEKLKEAWETFGNLAEIDGYWRGSIVSTESLMGFGTGAEQDSIDLADLFGDRLLDHPDIEFEPNCLFDPITDNPFAGFLRKLAKELKVPGIVVVDEGKLNFSSDFKFPKYDLCPKELEQITTGSQDAKRALETCCVRLPEIPDELMQEDASEERSKWLEERLRDTFKVISEKENRDKFAEIVASHPQGEELRSLLEKTCTSNSEDKQGDD